MNPNVALARLREFSLEVAAVHAHSLRLKRVPAHLVAGEPEHPEGHNRAQWGGRNPPSARVLLGGPMNRSAACLIIFFLLARPPLHGAAGLDSLGIVVYPLLSNEKVKAQNHRAVLLVDVPDTMDDDRGTGRYSYPLNPGFVTGSFDIAHFTVTTDTTNAYFSLTFRALSDPGWHPEYGFQLTFAAIAIDEDSIAGSGKTTVPYNARYQLNPRYAYEKLLLIGGGLLLEDTTGKAIVAYIPIPGDEVHPLGQAHSRTINFALPLSYLGRPTPTWRFTVLVGGQDDHGGSGLGEFRTVNPDPGEWNGGGRRSEDEPNVYDVLTVHVRRGDSHYGQ